MNNIIESHGRKVLSNLNIDINCSTAANGEGFTYSGAGIGYGSGSGPGDCKGLNSMSYGRSCGKNEYGNT